jgi:hypothetical protein
MSPMLHPAFLQEYSAQDTRVARRGQGRPKTHVVPACPDCQAINLRLQNELQNAVSLVGRRFVPLQGQTMRQCTKQHAEPCAEPYDDVMLVRTGSRCKFIVVDCMVAVSWAAAPPNGSSLRLVRLACCMRALITDW